MKLRDLMAFADKKAVQMFHKQGQVYPMYHCINADGDHVVFPMPPGSKDGSVALVRAGMELLKVTSYVFIDEMWFMEAGNDKSADQLREYMQNNSLADMPGSVEALMVTAESETEGMIMAWRRIKRDGGKASLGDLEIQDMGGFEGRMVGLLPRRKLSS